MSRRDRRRDPPLPRIVVGVAIVALGAIVFLHRARGIDYTEYLDWWPVALIALGLAQLPYRRWVAAGWWLLIGAYFLLPRLGMAPFQLRQILGLWPLMISLGGATLVIHALRPGERSFSAAAVMAGNVRKVGARFKGGEAVAVMGGCDVDLTAATIEGEAVLDVLAFWGGIDIRVPPGWDVEDRVTPILGAYDDRTTRAAAGAPRLVIRGSAVMGGVGVRHPKEESET